MKASLLLTTRTGARILAFLHWLSEPQFLQEQYEESWLTTVHAVHYMRGSLSLGNTHLFKWAPRLHVLWFRRKLFLLLL